MAMTTTAEILNTRSLAMTSSEMLHALQAQRTRCTVWSRVMDYHRPVEGFNIGKKGEHKERVFFDENFNTSKQCVKNLKKINTRSEYGRF